MNTNSTYHIIIFQSEDEKQVQEVFTLHEGENIIGSSNSTDILIQLPDNSIESSHAKIIVKDNFNDIGIEDISISNTIYKERNGIKIQLKKQREYEMLHMRNFYLTKKMRFYLFEGTLHQIENFLCQHKLSFYFEYLQQKLKSIYYKNNEDDFNNNKQINIENKNAPNEITIRKEVNSEDFNNFDYIPGEDEYINNTYTENNSNHIKTRKQKEKILTEVLELPTNINDILTNQPIYNIPNDNNNNYRNNLSQEEDDFSKMLSQRLRKNLNK